MACRITELGETIHKWGGTELVEVDGLQVTRLPWIASVESEQIIGVCYGVIDKGDLLCCIDIPVDEDRINTVQTIEKFIRNLKRQ